MKSLTLILVIFTVNLVHADDKIKMYYTNEELAKVIEVYSKASGQKFVVDPSVHGKISIFLQEPINET